MGKKKILYGISNFGGDMGGHLRSLRAILQEMAKQPDVEIHVVLFSLHQPKEGRYSFPTPHFHIITNEFSGVKSMYFMKKDVRRRFRNEGFDIIHAFDSNAFYFLKSLGQTLKIPMVLTKCGGPPAPKWKYPSCKNITLFSVEDLSNFQNQQRFRRTQLHLIPNRVKAPQQDVQLIEALKEKYSGGFDFIRISRFARLHEHSLMQSISLIKFLRSNGFHKRLLILGGIEDMDVYLRIQAALEDGIHLETDQLFCKEASKIIDVADMVIGSGRGLMEAASLGKILLAPNKNLELPVLVEQKSFSSLFHHNFSGRTKFDQVYAEENKNNILELASGTNRDRITQFSTQMFHEHFDIKNGIPKYLSVYAAASYKRNPDPIGSLAQTLVMTKHFIKK